MFSISSTITRRNTSTLLGVGVSKERLTKFIKCLHPYDSEGVNRAGPPRRNYSFGNACTMQAPNLLLTSLLCPLCDIIYVIPV